MVQFFFFVELTNVKYVLNLSFEHALNFLIPSPTPTHNGASETRIGSPGPPRRSAPAALIEKDAPHAQA